MRDLTSRIGDRPIIGMYGAGHLNGFQDMDELLTAATGRPTITVSLGENRPLNPGWQVSVRDLQEHTRERLGGQLDVPEILYRQDTGEVRRMRPDHLTLNGCQLPENWMSDLCSLNVTGTLDISSEEGGRLTPPAQQPPTGRSVSADRQR